MSYSLQKLESPSAQRNKQPIAQVLRRIIYDNYYDYDVGNRQHQLDDKEGAPTVVRLLEVASGAGIHASYFTEYFSNHHPDDHDHRNIRIEYQPTDPEPESLDSIRAYANEVKNDKIRPTNSSILLDPLPLTLVSSGIQQTDTDQILKNDSFLILLSINMVHISTWPDTTLGLLLTAQNKLKVGGRLILYGPFRQENVPFAPSNERFDEWLKDQNPNYGVRKLEDITELARAASLTLEETIEMPANNLCVVFVKEATVHTVL